ncbi:hypothetical protein N7444_002188 [Penicillium canescens]|nr:hypothetical protein N7444_002188 [Penicillium canescens]
MASISFPGNNHGIQVGDNHGSINAEFHLPPVRPETPPSPLSTVPFARDPDFVSRDTLFHRIHEKSSVPGSRIALVGLGGVGKSQLAIEYSYQVRSKSPATWIFWVHASNEARFEQSFRDIADQVKITGRQDPQANIFKLVENWLRDEKRGKWVLILDNIDVYEVLYKSPATGRRDQKNSLIDASTKPLLEYLPRSLNGFVIITTRSREVALKMVDHKDLFEVKPMERPEALKLLQRKLEQPGESQESQQLVEELEFMPLAIVQAASYIRNRAPRCSVSQYLRVFQKSDCEATKLLNTDANGIGRDWEAENSILVTLQISFDYIRRTNPSSASLLSLMSFFDRHEIPEDLLRVQPESNSHLSRSESSDDSSEDGQVSESGPVDNFEDDVATLRNFSFISISKNGIFFTMHRLVQLTIRSWLKTHGQTEQWKEKFISTLYHKFPTGQYENWEICRPLFPHVKAAMSQRPESDESLREWATLLYNGAWYASRSGILADVRAMASKSRKQRTRLLGVEDEETLDSTAMLATAWSLEGHWQEAERLEVQVMEARKAQLGDDHLSTLTSMANLASTYKNQGRWEEAEQLQAQVMEKSMTKLGNNHPDTLTSMANLAATLWNQGKWEDAEKLEVQVMVMSLMKLGEGHPDTLISMANLAVTYRNQGRWEEAESLEVYVIEARKTKLGEQHPDTLMSMANLASTYRSQGRYDEAEMLAVQVMEARKAKLGDDHPSTLTSMANLAMTYRSQGRYDEAESLEVQVMETSKTKLGEQHPDTLMSMGNLASTFWDQGKWEEAEHLDVQVMEIRMIKLGGDHPDTLASMANLAATFWNQGQWEKAEHLFMQVMERSKTKLGNDHPDTLRSMGNLASTYRSQGRWEEAEQIEVQVMKTSKSKLGDEHPSTLISMANLASTYRSQGRYDEAEMLEVQVMEARKAKLGDDHPSTLTSIGNLASTFWNQGRWKEAEQLQMQVMAMSLMKLGEDHPSTLTSIDHDCQKLGECANVTGSREFCRGQFLDDFIAQAYWLQRKVYDGGYLH